MTRYADRTEVSSDRSRAEIERTLRRYNASGFMYGWEGDQAAIAFQMEGRRIRFVLTLPDRNADEFLYTPGRGYARTKEQATIAWEQACRQRWRALALVVKAKLEAIEAGITTFEEEFLAHIVLPGGPTVGAWMLPQVAHAYETGRMPPLLPSPKEGL